MGWGMIARRAFLTGLSSLIAALALSACSRATTCDPGTLKNGLPAKQVQDSCGIPAKVNASFGREQWVYGDLVFSSGGIVYMYFENGKLIDVQWTK